MITTFEMSKSVIGGFLMESFMIETSLKKGLKRVKRRNGSKSIALTIAHR